MIAESVLRSAKTALRTFVSSLKAEIGEIFRKIYEKKPWAVPMNLAAVK